MLTVIAIGIGTLSYACYGANTADIVLLNLDDGSTAGAVAKVLYVCTIMGSYVLVIQPIFSTLEGSQDQSLEVDSDCNTCFQFCW